MRLWIAAALLAVAGCDGPPTGADGYAFGPAEYRRESVTVEIVTHQSLPALQRAARAHGAVVERDRDLQAFARISGKGCTIHIVEPAQRWQPEWLGHEMAHCLFGRWHK